MNIGSLAKESGVSAKLIRHYESIGLIPKASRSDGGYRQYGEQDVQFLRFVRRARGLGFSMKEIKQLLGLWKNKSRASADVKKLALTHLKELEVKIQELQDMATQLRHLAKTCHGDHRPDCPILKELENNKELS
ncbi:MAG: Cu(I)-responsive transcriptional regulator [Bdellovibrionaceae bacterium]|nr:Cu(I)-responsive transcriptional regulator [Pseudobdellovibrionaceae bacterium]